jgi:hypothetical protein
VAAYVPVFPSRHAREKRFWRPIKGKLIGRPFFRQLCSALHDFFHLDKDLRKAVIAQARSLKVHIGGKNDQIDRCCFCLDLGNIRAGHVARTASSAGWHDHASP